MMSMVLTIVILLSFALVGCDPIETVKSAACGEEYNVAALRHLPQRDYYGDCDAFVCKPETAAAIHSWTVTIRALADRQTDWCVTAAYRGCAWYFDHKADEDAAHWQQELRARAIEQTMSNRERK